MSGMDPTGKAGRFSDGQETDLFGVALAQAEHPDTLCERQKLVSAQRQHSSSPQTKLPHPALCKLR